MIEAIKKYVMNQIHDCQKQETAFSKAPKEKMSLFAVQAQMIAYLQLINLISRLEEQS